MEQQLEGGMASKEGCLLLKVENISICYLVGLI